MPHMGFPLPMIIALFVIALVIVLLVRFFSRAATRAQLKKLGHSSLLAISPSGSVSYRSSFQSEERDTYMVIPDISGYTKFISLNQFSVGHAQHVISQLLDSIITSAQPPLTASRVEGDSVVFFAPFSPKEGEKGVTGDKLSNVTVDLLNAYYHKRARLIRENGCPCSACTHIGDLDLKIIIHRGPIVRYRLRGLEDLSGVAVIETHRLLKNSLGLNRYVLVTDAASEGLKLPFEKTHDRHSETYEGVGDISCDVYQFDPVTLEAEVAPEPPSRMISRSLDIIGKLKRNSLTLRRFVVARFG